MIDAKTQQELREKYNPDGSLPRKAQLRMLDMLIFIDKICQENGISYWLDGGTLLGAARHGGFLPWDDDIDIAMRQKDAERFKEYMLSHPNPEYAIQCRETDPAFHYSWYRLKDLRSEYIDDSPKFQKYKYKGFQIDILIFETGISNAMKKFTKALRFRNPIYCLIHKIDALFADRNIITNWYGSPFKKRWQLRDTFPLSEIEFEGHRFSCPHDVDAYLTTSFGDWQTIPEHPVTHQVSFRFLD